MERDGQRMNTVWDRRWNVLYIRMCILDKKGNNHLQYSGQQRQSFRGGSTNSSRRGWGLGSPKRLVRGNFPTDKQTPPVGIRCAGFVLSLFQMIIEVSRQEVMYSPSAPRETSVSLLPVSWLCTCQTNTNISNTFHTQSQGQCQGRI